MLFKNKYEYEEKITSFYFHDYLYKGDNAKCMLKVPATEKKKNNQFALGTPPSGDSPSSSVAAASASCWAFFRSLRCLSSCSIFS